MDKEVIARTIVNILDVKRCREWQMFAGSDLYDVLYKYLAKIVHGDDEALRDIDKLMARNELTINKIANNQELSLETLNGFMENLRSFKRKYLMPQKKTNK